MNQSQQAIIEEKLKKAGIGHFIDIHVKLFDSFAATYPMINSCKLKQNQF